MEDCIFCKIINKEIPCKSVFENEELIAFHDIHPKANTHVLIVPKKHIEMVKTLNEMEGDGNLMGRMILAGRDIAKSLDLKGYQLVFNVDKEGGQEVFHIHLHLLAN